MHSKCLLLATFLLGLWLVKAQQNSLTSEVNPGCTPQDAICKNSALVHIESSGPNGTYHFLWSFIEKFPPAIFAFQTDSLAKLQVNWEKLSNNSNAKSFQFVNGSVMNSFAVEVTHLYFINATIDNHKKAPDGRTIYTVPLEKITWNAVKQVNSNNEIRYQFESEKNPQLNGSVSFVLSAHSQSGRSDTIPRLQFSESSNIFQVTLNNIWFPYNADNKYAQAQLVSNLTLAFGGDSVDTNLKEYTTIDDEYTPGVFQRFIYSFINSDKGNANAKRSYVEWKPVAYYDAAKQIAKSIKVIDPVVNRSSIDPHSMLSAYFLGQKCQANVIGLAFGNADDAFNFQDSRYLEFSLSSGLNSAPEERISGTLRIIIAVGLGLPMILFVISIIYTIVRKIRSTNNDFSTLNEES